MNTTPKAAAVLLAGALLLAGGCGSRPGRPAPGAPSGGAAGAAPADFTPVAPPPEETQRAAASPFLGLVIEDPNGRAVHFADFAGKVVLIDMWASWCGPCRMSIPDLNELYDRYRDRGLVVVGVSIDRDPADVLEFQRRIPMRYPGGMFNPSLAGPVGGEPTSIPTSLLLDRRGALKRRFIGYVDAGTIEREILKFL